MSMHAMGLTQWANKAGPANTAICNISALRARLSNDKPFICGPKAAETAQVNVSATPCPWRELWLNYGQSSPYRLMSSRRPQAGPDWQGAFKGPAGRNSE
jgi:hypothetical protein